MKLHFHDWSKWSLPIPTYNGNKQQWRICNVCNKATFSTLQWDKQSPLDVVRQELSKLIDGGSK